MADAQRLRDIDAGKYFDLVERMLAAADKVDPPKPADALVDQINLYLKAGRVTDLAQESLPAQLQADADLTPNAMYVLGGHYLDGLAVAKNTSLGLQYLERSALAGNADALLDLAKMTLDGAAVPGWRLQPSLAVMTAFGDLVGKLDPAICGRVERIAREYAHGDIVAQDYDVSEKWYELAADLGDASAAWKVASMNLVSEQITKDNAVLIKCMAMAADGGVRVGSSFELGKIYQAGALVPADPNKAEHYLAMAEAAGDRDGLIALTSFLESKLNDPSVRQRYDDALAQLVTLDGAPGWAYTKLSLRRSWTNNKDAGPEKPKHSRCWRKAWPRRIRTRHRRWP